MNREIKEAFDQVRADERLKASAKRSIREVRRRKRTHAPQLMRAAAVMASVLVCVLCLGGYSYLRTPVSYISIDVNPSIELSLNRLDRVVSAQAFNDDGEIVLREMNVVGKPYMQAIDEILDSEAMRPYLTEDAALSFTVASGDRKSERLLMDGINSCASCQKHHGQSYRADGKVIQEAHHYGMSFGKYMAYQKVVEQGGDLTIEACQGMNMAQIREMIRHTDEEGEHQQRRHRRSGHTEKHH